MLENIFGSRTRVKLFRLFLTHPDEKFFVREITRVVHEQINSVRRELTNLEKIGLLKSTQDNKRKYFTVSKDFLLLPELRALILKSRLTLEKEFIQSVRNIGSISYLALTGYFVNDPEGKVDLFVIGKINRHKLDTLLETFKKSFGTQLRFTVMSRDEYAYRRDVTDKFLYEIMNGKKVVVIDKIGELTR